jgi:hypothetical protein
MSQRYQVEPVRRAWRVLDTQTHVHVKVPEQGRLVTFGGWEREARSLAAWMNSRTA